MSDVGSLDFLAKLNVEQERLSRLEHLIARKRLILRDGATRIRLGVSPDEVALSIVRVCRAELAELGDLDEGDEG